MGKFGVLLSIVLGACVGAGDPGPADPGSPHGGGKADEFGGELPAFVWCTGNEHAPTKSGHWRHHSSSFWTKVGDPRHTAQDVVGAPGGIATVRGKFAYGGTSKDLEDEWVDVYVNDCEGFTLAGRALTDDDGRVAFELDASDLGPGAYDLSLEVEVDASVARSTLWLLPDGTHVVVSDIDGTLTTSDGELVVDLFADFFKPILDGDYVPRAYPGGPEMLGAHADHGEVIVYLTGRPHWLTDSSRTWLNDLGFPPGILHTTDTTGEGWPDDAGVGEFKRKYLVGLMDAGLVVDDAYGNATTDVYAYANAGLAPESTWIIGPHAGEGDTNAVEDGWDARAAEVEAGPDVAQPFAW